MFEIVQGNIDEAMAAMYKMPIFEIRDESKVRALLIAYADYMKKVDVQVLVETMNNGSMRGDLAIKFAPIVFRVIRVFSLLEGICKDLDPEFNYDKVFAKYMQVMDSEYVGYKVNSDIKRVAKLLLKNLD
jgi:predicted unusual protein kinase regulating ubiquinone biosynthesis (AarF/ABC1/UbiB family)